MASKLLPLWMTDATFHLVNWETEIGRNLRSKIKELQNSYWESRQFNSHKGSASYIYTPLWDWCTTMPFEKCRNMMCFVVRSPHVLFCPCCICTSRTGPSLNMSSPVCLLLLPTLTAGQWIGHIVMPHLCICDNVSNQDILMQSMSYWPGSRSGVVANKTAKLCSMNRFIWKFYRWEQLFLIISHQACDE